MSEQERIPKMPWWLRMRIAARAVAGSYHVLGWHTSFGGVEKFTLESRASVIARNKRQEEQG